MDGKFIGKIITFGQNFLNYCYNCKCKKLIIRDCCVNFEDVESESKKRIELNTLSVGYTYIKGVNYDHEDETFDYQLGNELVINGSEAEKGKILNFDGLKYILDKFVIKTLILEFPEVDTDCCQSDIEHPFMKFEEFIKDEKVYFVVEHLKLRGLDKSEIRQVYEKKEEIKERFFSLRTLEAQSCYEENRDKVEQFYSCSFDEHLEGKSSIRKTNKPARRSGVTSESFRGKWKFENKQKYKQKDRRVISKMM